MATDGTDLEILNARLNEELKAAKPFEEERDAERCDNDLLEHELEEVKSKLAITVLEIERIGSSMIT